MTNKIYKYVYKLNKILNEKQFEKINLYKSHLEYHSSMSGGSEVSNKINELETLFNELQKLPNFGINDALENKLRKTTFEYDELSGQIKRTMTDIMNHHGLEEQAKKLFSI